MTRGPAGRGSLLQRRDRAPAIPGSWSGPGPPAARQPPMTARFGSSHIRLWIALVLAAVVAGTLGYVVIEGWAPLDALYMTREAGISWPSWGPDADHGMLQEFIAIVRDRRPPAVTGIDGLRAVEIVDAAYRSIAAGEPVSLVPEGS